MEKTLVIVESPAKAKSISKFLGRKYFVRASMGHVRDLPKSQFGVDIENGFAPKYITIRGKGEIIKELRSAVKKADRVLLASDPDREGEAIAWHLLNLLEMDASQPCRIEFNEITKQAVQKAVQNPRPIDMNRVNAQQARRILDRLVGYNLSPLLWRKVKKGLSAGRVQSVAVRLIVDREEEIGAFVPEEYWTLIASLQKENGQTFTAKLHKIGNERAQVGDAATMQKIIQELENVAYRVAAVQRKEKLRHAPLPFITSTLQQEASRKLNFTARKTMLLAQQLYEGIELGSEGPVGLVTYIRTDSSRVSETARQEAARYISERYGSSYVPEKVRRAPARGRIQDAHEAIRPTAVYREPDTIKQYLTTDQYKLYRLIWSRFVASQMSPAVYDTTTVDVAAGKYLFRASGAVLRFSGFMQVYIEGTDEEEKETLAELPELVENELLKQVGLEPRQHFTQPPSRYNDATLIKALEEKGIGRPSTYAPIVETILKRGYVVREKKLFYPTELGILVVHLLKDYFPRIIDVEFTASVEEKLDEVEEGAQDWVKLLEDFYGPFQETLHRAEEEIGRLEVADEVSEETCPQCGRNLVYKMGRFGKFLACPGFPECRFTKPLLEATGVPCPHCGGEMVQRRSKKGRVFYGCSRYPQCEFVVWDRPTNEKCPVCGSMMVLKSVRGQEQLRCTNETAHGRETPVTGTAAAKASAAGKAAAGAKPAGSRKKAGTAM